MHPDDKLANHGKQVSGESGSHIPSVNQQAQQQQGAAGHLGPKGGNGVKSNQMSPGSCSLKSVSPTGGMLKTKSKRERSVSTDSDVRNVRTSVESDAKGESIMRSKRRCVLERKQPYSGDEWCSGPDTEDDEEKPQTAIRREKIMVGPVQGHCDLRSSDSGAGPGLKVEPKQTSPQLVYVFTTSLANSAADAVLKGQSDSILLFHQQNVPRPKLEQKTPNIQEKFRSSSSPLGCDHKSQSGTARPSSADGVGITLQAGTLPSSGHPDNELSQTRSSTEPHNNTNVTRAEGSCLPEGLVPASRDRETLEGMISSVSPSQSPTAQSLHHQSAQAQRLCHENLSKEQLEHRERSLQTLRDIERLFLRTATNPEHGDPESASNNPNNSPSITERSSTLEGTDSGRTISGGNANNNVLSSSQIGNLRKYEEPLQSIISQTQALHGPQVAHNIDHPHHQMSSPGIEIGHLLGPEGLTPEQIRRQQEMQPSAHSQDFRISEMQMQGGPMMLRGPPPPYHSKPGEPQWTNMMAGGVRGNTQILDMQEGPHGSRFLVQTPRGPPGAGFSGPFPLENAGHQRPVRPGMPWLDELPNDTGTGGLYTSGTGRHLQGNTERLIAREMIRTVGQCQMLRTLRLSKQQQHSSLMSRLMDNPGGPDFPNLMMGRGPQSQKEPLDFPGSRDILGSPGAGPQIKDLVDSPLGSNVPLSMNLSMNIQQQQLNLAQKLRVPSEIGPVGEIFGPALPQGRPLQNRQGEKMGMNPGPDGPFQFPNQSPFSGGQVEGSYLQSDPDMFEEQGPNQTGGTMRLTHMPMARGFRGSDGRSRHSSDPSLNPLTSPSLPASHGLKSPSEEPVPSPLLPSPSGTKIKSPSKMSSVVHQPPLPPASGAGTPSASMKSPAIVGSSNQGLQSPSASPGQLKSPAVCGATGSPGWASPKPALPSPVLTSGITVGNGGPSDTDQSLPPRSSTSTPISQQGSTNTSAPFTSSSEVPPSQNPLSLIMSQMSKYAMPSTTPLYHDAIKTLASSDDEMLPDRPLLSGVSIGGNIGNAHASQLLGPELQSPMGIISHGQHQLSHDASGSMLSSPNQATLSSINSVMIGGSAADGIGLCNVSPLSQNQIGGFPRLQSSRLLHSPVGEMSQNFNQSNDNIMPPQQLHMISKGLPNQRHPPPDSFGSLRDGPDLREVIRPSPTGIPEFDLSRIIPCDKPSSILQYFPKSDLHQNPSQRPPSQQPSPQLLKQLSSTYPPQSNGSSSNPHIAHLQNMMAEQQLQPPSHFIGRQGMGGPRGMVSGAGIGPMCPPGQMMGRPAMSLQQQQHGMMPNNSLHHSVNLYQGMMSSQQHTHSTMAQHNMMMQAKQQGLAIPGDPFGPQGPLLSPQGPVMGLPQPGMMGPQSIRQRGMSLGSAIGYGPGGMPF
uniref:Bcl9 like n=1 Tax=Neogobius melanostomus TaxID=47308 RepID=A0A8C6S6B1_9GOBI